MLFTGEYDESHPVFRDCHGTRTLSFTFILLLSLHHSLALAADGSLFAWGGGEVGQVGTGDARDKLVPQCISPMVPIRGSDGEVAAHALRFAHCSAGSHHSMALVAVPGLNAVAFNPVAVVSSSNVVSARISKNLTLLVETAM